MISGFRNTATLLFSLVAAAVLLAGGPVSASGRPTPDRDDQETPADTPLPPTEHLPPWQRELTGQDKQRVEELQNQIAELRGQGKYAEANPLAEDVLSTRQRIQGADHWETSNARQLSETLRFIAAQPAEVQAEMAEADAIDSNAHELNAQGRYAELLELMSKQREIRSRVLGPTHLYTMNSANNMGYLLDALGKPAEAEPLFRETLETRRRVLGNSHPHTLISMNNLGYLFQTQGKLAEAEPLIREALDGYRRVLGDDHPDTLRTLANMGVLLNKQNKLTEAEPFYRESLESRRKILGDDHWQTLFAIGNMGNLLDLQGRLAEAELYYREALEGRRRILGQKHPHTLKSMNNMGSLLNTRGRLVEAEPLLRETLEGRYQVLGPNHPDTLTSINNLGNLLKTQQRLDEAEPLLREALVGHRRVWGADHRKTLISMTNLAFVLEDRGSLTEAEVLYHEVLESNRRVLGDDHRDTLTSMNNLGGLLKAQGRLLEAETLYRQTLSGRRRILGNLHPKTLSSIDYLGNLCRIQGQLIEAESLLREAVEGFLTVHGTDHPNVARCCHSLASLLYAKSEFAEAESMWVKAADSFEAARLQVSYGGLERVSFTAERSPLTQLTACLVRNGKPLPAWRRFEATLARGLLDALSARHSRPLTDSERSREDALIARINKLDEGLGAAADAEEGEVAVRAGLDQLRKKRNGIQTELARFEADMAKKHGAAAGEVYELSRIQAQLPSDAALLGWVDIAEDTVFTGSGVAGEGGEHWACVVRHRGEPVWIELPGSGESGAWTTEDSGTAEKLRESLRQRPRGPETKRRLALIRQLHTQRIAPVESSLAGVSRLIILPAGRMAGLPVEVLTDEYTVSYAPSGTMYAWLREQSRSQDRQGFTGPVPLLALGDPLFPAPPEPATLPEPPEYGVLVAMVTPDSNATRSGLREGDVLLTYGNERLTSPDDLSPAIEKASNDSGSAEKTAGPTAESAGNEEPSPKPSVPVNVWRNGEALKLAVSPGKLGIRPASRPASEAILAQRGLDELLAGTRGQSFTPLPGSRREVEEVARLFTPVTGKPRPMVLLDAEASEERLEALSSSGELSKFRVLHLATHGVMDDQQAMQSAMILSAPASSESLEQVLAGRDVFDGRLTGEQIVRTWKLDADLVTLSGCETGLGRESGGEGYLGFAQALFVAGARSLVLSLWKVDDRATMLLMERFYQNVLGRYDDPRRLFGLEFAPGTPLPKAEALIEAKVWLRDVTAGRLAALHPEYPVEGTRGAGSSSNVGAPSATYRPYEDPYYWAAFVLIGNPG